MMSERLRYESHGLGVTFAVIAVLIGMGYAIVQTTNRLVLPQEILEILKYTLGSAFVAYVVVRIVGLFFSAIAATTREHKVRR
jgi:hypothetical protein